MTILVTGGAGFIGANFVRDWIAARTEPVVNLDKLTYAGNLGNLTGLDPAQHIFVRGDICDGPLLSSLLRDHAPRALLNLAAETHVDRSITGPAPFIATNITGTFTLLEAARKHIERLGPAERAAFRFLQVSTDEVYGSIPEGQSPATEEAPFRPNSPYSASKAAADHLIRAYGQTYGLPVITTHCSNNYGPLQYPEKLIPVAIGAACAGQPIPVYGAGRNIRDWLHVADHCAALRLVLDQGEPGRSYNVGGGAELENIALVREICAVLDELRPGGSVPHEQLIAFVADRPGHDFRYAIDAGRLRRELGWEPVHDITDGLRQTVRWYLDNEAWVAGVRARQEAAA